MSTDTILEARGLRKEFSGFVVIDNLDLSVKRGEIHALIGPNGAGKSTLFNLLTCFLPATQGHLYYNGKEITDMHPADVAKLGMVRSFQISAVLRPSGGAAAGRSTQPHRLEQATRHGGARCCAALARLHRIAPAAPPPEWANQWPRHHH